MKLSISGILAAVLLLGCVHTPKVLTGPDKAKLTADVSVALVQSDKDGTNAYCSATWVGGGFILTAAHCIKGFQDATDTKDDDLWKLTFNYVTHDDVNDASSTPTNIWEATYAGMDVERDLGLLYSSKRPDHPSANLALHTPPVGSEVTSIGETSGFYWTFQKGVVANYREDMSDFVDKTGPFLQLSMPLSFGDSGGGVFDEQGNLIGVASFINKRVPLMSFAVHLDNIRAFLEKEHVLQTGLHKG